MGKRGKALKRKRDGLGPAKNISLGTSVFMKAKDERIGDDSDDVERGSTSFAGEGAAGKNMGGTDGGGSIGSDGGSSDEDDDENSDCMLGGLSEADIATAIRVVNVLGERLELFRSRPFKAMRVAVHPLVHEQMRRFDSAESGGGSKNRKPRDRRYGGSGDASSAEYLAGTNRGRLNHLKPAERRKQMDRDALNARLLRAERLERLEALNSEGGDDEVRKLRVPDGVAGLLTFDASDANKNGREGSAGAGAGGETQRLLTSGGGDLVVSGGEVGSSDRGKVVAVEATEIGAPTRLQNSIGCYICKAPFQELHFFYANLCPACASLNWRKREESADLRGAVVVVTGCRVKIGFRCALKCLRAGATVIATTRFVRDAARRFVAEQDSKQWGSRLHLYGLDFRNLRMLERWCDLVTERYDRLDAIVNNACQTIRRPPQFYQHLLPLECASPDSELFKEKFCTQRLGGAGGATAMLMLSHDGGDSDRQRLKQLPALASSASSSSSSSTKLEHRRLSSIEDQSMSDDGGGDDEDDPIVAGMTIPDNVRVVTAAAAATAGVTTAGVALLSQLPVLRSDVDDTGGDAANNENCGGGNEKKKPRRGAVFTTGSGSVVNLDRSPTPSASSAAASPPLPEHTTASSSSSSSSSLATVEAKAAGATAFPSASLDVNEQQVDVRRVNSWLLKLDQVSTGEAAEVMAINALAPFILNGRLRHLMERSPPLPAFEPPPSSPRASNSAPSAASSSSSSSVGPKQPKFIVNVSAMEGKFYRFKTANHPHTNMAKAALNMMTRTSAAEYAKSSNIFMTAVDTGWINDEKPLERASQHAATHNFQTPLDEVDAASRVLDPIMGPLLRIQERGLPHDAPSGVFLKDYAKCEW